MKTKNEPWCQNLFLGLMTLIFMAGCAPSVTATQAADPPVTATSDPLYTLHCIHQSGRNDYCYVDELLATNTELLEKVTRNYCLDKLYFGWCAIYIWKDEASVANSLPLSEDETASLIAKFRVNPNAGQECFEAFNNGEVVYSSKDCDQ